MKNLKKIYIDPKVDESLIEEFQASLVKDKDSADLVLSEYQNLWNSKIGKVLLKRFEGEESSIHTDLAFKDALDDVQVIKILDLNLPGYYVDLISTNMKDHALKRELVQKDIFSIFHQLFCLFQDKIIQLPIDLEFGKNSDELILQLTFENSLENRLMNSWFDAKSSIKILDHYSLESSSKTVVSFVWSEKVLEVVEIFHSKKSFEYIQNKKGKNAKVLIDTRELEPRSQLGLKPTEVAIVNNIVKLVEENEINGLKTEDISEIIKGHPEREVLEKTDIGVERIIDEYMLNESGREKIKEEYSKVESALMDESLVSMVIKSLEETTVEELNIISGTKDQKEKALKIEGSTDKAFEEIIKVKGEKSQEGSNEIWTLKRVEIAKELKNREQELSLIKDKKELEREVERIFSKELTVKDSSDLYQALENKIIFEKKEIIDEKISYDSSEMNIEKDDFQKEMQKLRSRNKLLEFQLRTAKQLNSKITESREEKEFNFKLTPLSREDEARENFKKIKEENIELKKKIEVSNSRLVQLSENFSEKKEVSESRLMTESLKLRTDNVKLNKELNTLKVRNRSSEIKISELEVKLEFYKSSKKTSAEEPKGNLKKSLAKKEKQFDELQVSMRNLENRERAAMVKIKSLEQKIKFLNVRLESSGKGLPGREKRGHSGNNEGKIRKLEQQNELLSQSKEKFKKELISKKGELQKARIENNGLKGRIAELERKTSKKSA